MKLLRAVDELLPCFRSPFSHRATYEWFVLLLFSLLLREQAAGVTSCVNALGLSVRQYRNALHFFHSTTFSALDLSRYWLSALLSQSYLKRLNGQLVFVADGIKTSKEGQRMPGVKRLHQESQDNSKPEWIRGHLFGMLALLTGLGSHLFATPVAVELHDGLIDAEPQSIVDRMARLAIALMPPGSYLVLDAYYTAANFLQAIRGAGLNAITRARINTVAYRPLPPRTTARTVGRPKRWGERVQLKTLFEQLETFTRVELNMYAEHRWALYRVIDLHWDSADVLVRFVLTKTPDGARYILLSTDVSLAPEQILLAYSWRFKIEVSFRALVHTMVGFGYHFWTKVETKAAMVGHNIDLGRLAANSARLVKRKIEAYQRFVTMAAIAMGILQHLALTMKDQVWASFPYWLLTRGDTPSEAVVRAALRNELERISPTTSNGLLLTKLIKARLDVPAVAHAASAA